MDIFRVSVKRDNPTIPDVRFKAGQTVTIVRLVTMEYTVDISSHLDDSGETDVSLEDLISYETEERDIEDVLDEADVLDDLVTSYKVS